jgi:hypothetical protein
MEGTQMIHPTQHPLFPKTAYEQGYEDGMYASRFRSEFGTETEAVDYAKGYEAGRRVRWGL